jgi:hypothetical protein
MGEVKSLVERLRDVSRGELDHLAYEAAQRIAELEAALRAIATGQVPNPSYDWAERDYANSVLALGESWKDL